MVKRVKIKVKTANKNINLPAIPISLVSFLVRTGTHWSKFTNDLDDNERKAMKQGMDVAAQILREAKPIWKELDPFTLVEVESEGTYVLIEMR